MGHTQYALRVNLNFEHSENSANSGSDCDWRGGGGANCILFFFVKRSADNKSILYKKVYFFAIYRLQCRKNIQMSLYDG
jgi:hypothetical protein